VNDCLGIQREEFALRPVGLFFMVYVVYAQLCFEGKLQEKVDPDEVLFFAIFFADMIFLVLPTGKVLVRKFLGLFIEAPGKVNKVYVCPVTQGGRHFKTASQLLKDETYSQLLRQHALRYFCAENVDFCVEVYRFKARCEHAHETIISLHKACFQIIQEFVTDGSPCEVNLPASQKSQILRFIKFETFCTLESPERRSIFDEALQEIENLIQRNIFDSFWSSGADRMHVDSEIHNPVFSI